MRQLPLMLLLVLFVCIFNGYGAETEGEDIEGAWMGDVLFVYHAGEWQLEISYLAIGTRSEGQQGTLLKDGKPVIGETVGASLLTPLGRLKYYGDKRQNPWDVIGWHFADRRKILPSKDMPRRSSSVPAEEIKPEVEEK
ncbi:MAG TPA: hypothetical protein DCS43_12855 [Verrucomicrobia bacterium]|nr:hypothetical protein [Verrucomicrobiota bacterium]